MLAQQKQTEQGQKQINKFEEGCWGREVFKLAKSRANPSYLLI